MKFLQFPLTNSCIYFIPQEKRSSLNDKFVCKEPKKPEIQINKQTECGNRALAGKKSATKYDKFGTREQTGNSAPRALKAKCSLRGRIQPTPPDAQCLAVCVCVFKCKSLAKPAKLFLKLCTAVEGHPQLLLPWLP